MTEPSENKVTKTDTIDKSRQSSVAPTKEELNKKELDKASGGFGFGGHFGDHIGPLASGK